MPIDYPKSGKDWEIWVRKWWDSMLIIPKNSNPIIDPTGKNFERFRQPEDSRNVWFLAGNLGGTSNRKIKVKKGKALFFPEVNFLACTKEGFAGLRSVKPKEKLGSKTEEVQDDLYFKSNQTNQMKDSQADQRKDAEEDITASEKTTSVDYKGPVNQKIRKRVPVDFWRTRFASPPVMGSGTGLAECLSDGFWIFTEPLEEVGETAYITIKSKHLDIEDSSHHHHAFNSKVKYEIEIVP